MTFAASKIFWSNWTGLNILAGVLASLSFLGCDAGVRTCRRMSSFQEMPVGEFRDEMKFIPKFPALLFNTLGS